MTGLCHHTLHFFVVKCFSIPETMTKRPSLTTISPGVPLIPPPPTSSSFSVCDFSRATVVLRSVFSSSNCCTLGKKNDTELRIQNRNDYREGSQSLLPEERDYRLGEGLRQSKYLRITQVQCPKCSKTQNFLSNDMMMPQTKIPYYCKTVSCVKLLAKSDGACL